MLTGQNLSCACDMPCFAFSKYGFMLLQITETTLNLKIRTARSSIQHMIVRKHQEVFLIGFPFGFSLCLPFFEPKVSCSLQHCPLRWLLELRSCLRGRGWCHTWCWGRLWLGKWTVFKTSKHGYIWDYTFFKRCYVSLLITSNKKTKSNGC